MAFHFRDIGAVLLALGFAGTAFGQSTDGYHSAQVIPVAVDSTSFVQNFSFTTPNVFPVTVTPTFHPGNDGPQLGCERVVIPARGTRVATSLRSLCANLPAGSQYGFLSLDAAGSSDDMYNDIPVFAVVSRVSNAAGAGFAVEAFPASTFTPGNTVVSGLRRLAATPGSPAYQSNCFIGYMPSIDLYVGAVVGPKTSRLQASTVLVEEPPEKVAYTVRTANGNFASSVTVRPGHMVRLLDVFAAAGLAAGDVDDASIEFESTHLNGEYGGLVTFCTVQENTNFTADFRIGKVSSGILGIASNDRIAEREVSHGRDLDFRNGAFVGRRFEIDAGASANTHVVYFRIPDIINCQLLDRATGVPLTAAAGLELRLIGPSGKLIGGGNDQVATGPTQLGDKRAYGGINSRFMVDVESNEQNVGAVRPYSLYCASGSGSTPTDLSAYKEPVDRF